MECERGDQCGIPCTHRHTHSDGQMFFSQWGRSSGLVSLGQPTCVWETHTFTHSQDLTYLPLISCYYIHCLCLPEFTVLSMKSSWIAVQVPLSKTPTLPGFEFQWKTVIPFINDCRCLNNNNISVVHFWSTYFDWSNLQESPASLT